MAEISSLWIYFNLSMLAMLIIDLWMTGKKNEKVSLKKSLGWSALWVALALLFNYVIYRFYGKEKALDFLTGYVIEKSLSIDNIFIILLIFQYFSIPERLQHRILFLGILGALIMRVAFIFLGVELITHLNWIIYVFGGILVFTGVKMLFRKDKKEDIGNSIWVRMIKKIIPFDLTVNSDKFFVKNNGKILATRLLLCLIVIEGSDLIFAIDSIPAILAITTDEFIVYSSNAFAILGLRSLYFALSGLLKLFAYLNYALGFILMFVGVKMMIAYFYQVPTPISLAIILSAIGTSIVLSLLSKNKSLKTSKNELV